MSAKKNAIKELSNIIVNTEKTITSLNKIINIFKQIEDSAFNFQEDLPAAAVEVKKPKRKSKSDTVAAVKPKKGKTTAAVAADTVAPLETTTDAAEEPLTDLDMEGKKTHHQTQRI